MGIQSGEWRARDGALPEWRAQWRAHTGLQRHRLVPRPTSIARAVALAVRARSARKTIVTLIFCVRCSPGDSAAATGWSGERRPMGPLAVSLPRPYRIVGVCRVSHAKHAWIADSVHQTDSAADRSFGHGGQSRAESCAPTRIVRAWARAHARPSQQSSDTRLCRGSNRRGSTRAVVTERAPHTHQGEVSVSRKLARARREVLGLHHRRRGPAEKDRQRRAPGSAGTPPAPPPSTCAPGCRLAA